MAHNLKARIRRLEAGQGGVHPHAVWRAQKALQAGEDPGDGKAAEVARRIEAFIEQIEASMPSCPQDGAA